MSSAAGTRHELPRVGPTRLPRPLLALCGACAGGALVYALAPLNRPAVDAPALDAPSPGVVPPRVAALDVDAFRAPIWVADPPPPPPPPPTAPSTSPPPLRLQLLAIVRDAGDPPVYRATLYDPDTDRLLVVAAGDKVGARTVERVDAEGVGLADASGPRSLLLREATTGGSR